MLTLLVGGARSGKSALAVELAGESGGSVTFVATSPVIPGDDDLAGRVARHRAERPSTWYTIEEEQDLATAVARIGTPFAIVDCLTVWVGNMMHHGHDDPSVLAASDAAIESVRRPGLDVIVISNEVGLGIVPDNQPARRYRDLLGRVNQMWVNAVDRALFMVAGRAIRLEDPRELLP